MPSKRKRDGKGRESKGGARINKGKEGTRKVLKGIAKARKNVKYGKHTSTQREGKS